MAIVLRDMKSSWTMEIADSEVIQASNLLEIFREYEEQEPGEVFEVTLDCTKEQVKASLTRLSYLARLCKAINTFNEGGTKCSAAVFEMMLENMNAWYYWWTNKRDQCGEVYDWLSPKPHMVAMAHRFNNKTDTPAGYCRKHSATVFCHTSDCSGLLMSYDAPLEIGKWLLRNVKNTWNISYMFRGALVYGDFEFAKWLHETYSDEINFYEFDSCESDLQALVTANEIERVQWLFEKYSLLRKLYGGRMRFTFGGSAEMRALVTA